MTNHDILAESGVNFTKNQLYAYLIEFLILQKKLKEA